MSAGAELRTRLMNRKRCAGHMIAKAAEYLGPRACKRVKGATYTQVQLICRFSKTLDKFVRFWTGCNYLHASKDGKRVVAKARRTNISFADG